MHLAWVYFPFPVSFFFLISSAKSKTCRVHNFWPFKIFSLCYQKNPTTGNIKLFRKERAKKMEGFRPHKSCSYKVWTSWEDALAHEELGGSSFLSWFITGAGTRIPALARWIRVVPWQAACRPITVL